MCFRSSKIRSAESLLHHYFISIYFLNFLSLPFMNPFTCNFYLNGNFFYWSVIPLDSIPQYEFQHVCLCACVPIWESTCLPEEGKVTLVYMASMQIPQKCSPRIEGSFVWSANMTTAIEEKEPYRLSDVLSACASFCLCVCLLVCLSLCLCICLSVYLSACLSVLSPFHLQLSVFKSDYLTAISIDNHIPVVVILWIKLVAGFNIIAVRRPNNYSDFCSVV